MAKEIQIKVTYTQDYKERFTKACVAVAEKRRRDESKKVTKDTQS